MTTTKSKQATFPQFPEQINSSKSKKKVTIVGVSSPRLSTSRSPPREPNSGTRVQKAMFNGPASRAFPENMYQTENDRIREIRKENGLSENIYIPEATGSPM